jgi:hypothetical protein
MNEQSTKNTKTTLYISAKVTSSAVVLVPGRLCFLFVCLSVGLSVCLSLFGRRMNAKQSDCISASTIGFASSSFHKASKKQASGTKHTANKQTTNKQTNCNKLLYAKEPHKSDASCVAIPGAALVPPALLRNRRSHQSSGQQLGALECVRITNKHTNKTTDNFHTSLPHP